MHAVNHKFIFKNIPSDDERIASGGAIIQGDLGAYELRPQTKSDLHDWPPFPEISASNLLPLNDR
jgi:hypothetical protein